MLVLITEYLSGINVIYIEASLHLGDQLYGCGIWCFGGSHTQLT